MHLVHVVRIHFYSKVVLKDVIAKILSNNKWETKMLTVITQNTAGWHKIMQDYHKSCELKLEGGHARALIWQNFPSFIH